MHCSSVSCEHPGIFVIIIIDLTVKSNKHCSDHMTQLTYNKKLWLKYN